MSTNDPNQFVDVSLTVEGWATVVAALRVWSTDETVVIAEEIKGQVLEATDAQESPGRERTMISAHCAACDVAVEVEDDMIGRMYLGDFNARHQDHNERELR